MAPRVSVKNNFFQRVLFSRLDRYFYRDLLPNYLFGLLFFTFLVMLNQLVWLAKMYFEYNFPFNQVLLLLLNQLPMVISFSIPFAVLPGYLLTMSRLSQDSELTAMKSCGISMPRVVLPGILFGIFISFFAFYFKDTVEVRANYNLIRLNAKLLAQKPAISLKEQSSLSMGIYKISFEKLVNEEGYEVLRNVYVVDTGGRKIIKAKKARLISNPENAEHYIMKFQNGTLTEVLEAKDQSGREEEHFFISSFNYLALNIYVNLPEDYYRKTPDTMNEAELRAEIARLTGTTMTKLKQQYTLRDQLQSRLQIEKAKLKKADKASVPSNAAQYTNVLNQLREVDKQVINIKQSIPTKYIQKYHEKFTAPVSAFLFAFLSLFLGMFNARSGRNEGLGISFLIMVTYYGVKVGVETLISKGSLPVLMEWFPNLAVATAAVVLMIVKKRQ